MILSVQTKCIPNWKSPIIKPNSSYFALIPRNLQSESLSVDFELFLLFLYDCLSYIYC